MRGEGEVKGRSSELGGGREGDDWRGSAIARRGGGEDGAWICMHGTTTTVGRKYTPLAYPPPLSPLRPSAP